MNKPPFDFKNPSKLTNKAISPNRTIPNSRLNNESSYSIDKSITEEDNQINQILNSLEQRLYQTDHTISELNTEKSESLKHLTNLSQRLNELKKDSVRKRQLFDHYEKILREGENALKKITESTKTLMLVVRKEKDDSEKYH